MADKHKARKRPTRAALLREELRQFDLSIEDGLQSVETALANLRADWADARKTLTNLMKED